MTTVPRSHNVLCLCLNICVSLCLCPPVSTTKIKFLENKIELGLGQDIFANIKKVGLKSSARISPYNIQRKSLLCLYGRYIHYHASDISQSL